MTFAEFLKHVHDVTKIHQEWRFGQSVFNALYQVRPDLADQIRASDLDPFYRDDRIRMCLHWIERNW